MPTCFKCEETVICCHGASSSFDINSFVVLIRRFPLHWTLLSLRRSFSWTLRRTSGNRSVVLNHFLLLLYFAALCATGSNFNKLLLQQQTRTHGMHTFQVQRFVVVPVQQSVSGCRRHRVHSSSFSTCFVCHNAHPRSSERKNCFVVLKAVEPIFCILKEQLGSLFGYLWRRGHGKKGIRIWVRQLAGLISERILSLKMSSENSHRLGHPRGLYSKSVLWGVLGFRDVRCFSHIDDLLARHLKLELLSLIFCRSDFLYWDSRRTGAPIRSSRCVFGMGSQC